MTPGIQPELALSLMKSVFSAGLQVAALQAMLGDSQLSDKAAAIVDQLDTVIRDIRAGTSV